MKIENVKICQFAARPLSALCSDQVASSHLSRHVSEFVAFAFSAFVTSSHLDSVQVLRTKSSWSLAESCNWDTGYLRILVHHRHTVIHSRNRSQELCVTSDLRNKNIFYSVQSFTSLNLARVTGTPVVLPMLVHHRHIVMPWSTTK